MRLFYLPLMLLVINGCASPSIAKVQTQAPHQSTLTKKQWLHGAEDCQQQAQPQLDVYQHSANTFVLRQNKCHTFEAPFIYVLAGSEKVLILDTGALEKDFSLYDELKQLLPKQHQGKDWLVLHSHSHGDHYAGDAEFENKQQVTLIGTSLPEIQTGLSIQNWPEQVVTLDLGDRNISIIPTPGHQEEAISLYDSQSQWLITGDSLYPGLIYIKDWQAYRQSIQRLSNFATQNPISAIMGAHIEMKHSSTDYYPIGTTYQPNEAALDLPAADLYQLNQQLQANSSATSLHFERFVIQPMSFLQRNLSDAARWLKN